MQIKELIQRLNRLEQTTHEFDFGANIAELSYYTVFNKIVARIDIGLDSYRFDIRINSNNDIEIDLTEEGDFIKIVGHKMFKLIINTILKEKI
jgi:hypothetical protein